MGHLLKTTVAVLAIGAFITTGAGYVIQQGDSLKLKSVEVKSLNTELDQLNLKYDDLNQQLEKANQDKDLNKQKVNELQDQKKKLEEEKKRLEQELQAKAEAKTKLAQASTQVVNTVTGTQTAYAASGIDCNNQTTAKAFIYCHESGNDPTSVNAYGCRGLGQACPGTKLPCGEDYACQDEYFTNYMLQRYHTWEAAKAFWLARVPINGKDVGNWW